MSDALNIPYNDTIRIAGADLTQQVDALVSRGINLGLKNSNCIKRDFIILQDNFVDFEKALGITVDGLIGGDFLRGLIVQFDFKEKKLILHDPRSFKIPEKFEKHKIKIKNFKPYIKANTVIERDTLKLDFLLDSGAGLAVMVLADSTSTNFVPKNVVLGHIGSGLGGEIDGFVGMINSLDFFGFNLQNIISHFQIVQRTSGEVKNRKDGLIGSGLLSRFELIIDYVTEHIYIQPTKNWNKEFQYDKSGLLVYAYGKDLDEYYVQKVYENSPAFDAGFKEGDKITKVGFWPLSFYSLQSINKMLRGDHNKELTFCVKRDGKTIKIKFRLKDPFLIPQKKIPNNK